MRARTRYAATDADLAEIRDQIRQLKESYEARIQALEQRLKEAEGGARARIGRRPRRRQRPAVAAAPRRRRLQRPSPRRRRTGIAAFNPAISAVLQGVYANLSQDPTKYAIAGFVPSGDIAPGPSAASASPSRS